MFNFESPTQQDSGAQSYKENMHGLEGICEECHGAGRTDQGFFKPKKMCGKCHGKGFLHPKEIEAKSSYSWDRGLPH
ncbi:MAG: hypothetical protein WAZ40_02350 [Minisyncoccia bacterium]